MNGTNTHDRQIFNAAMEKVRDEVGKRAEDRELLAAQCVNPRPIWCHSVVVAELTSLDRWLKEQIEDES